MLSAIRIGVLAVAAGASSHVAALTGNDLLGFDRTNKVAAIAYVRGMYEGMSGASLLLGSVAKDSASRDAIDSAARSSLPCFPRGVTVEQVYDVVIKSLVEDPASRHEGAGSLTYAALMAAWPCPGRR